MAPVTVSPVAAASAWASSTVSEFLMFKLTVEVYRAQVAIHRVSSRSAGVRVFWHCFRVSFGPADPDAVRQLIEQTQGELRRLLGRLVDPASADDLVQDTYLRALTALPRFRGEASPRTWLFVIARRVAADELRARTRERALLAGVAPLRPDAASDPGDSVVAAELVAALPGARRQAFVLTQLHGLPYADAASVAGVPVGTVRSRVARAREVLAAAYGGE